MHFQRNVTLLLEWMEALRCGARRRHRGQRRRMDLAVARSSDVGNSPVDGVRLPGVEPRSYFLNVRGANRVKFLKLFEFQKIQWRFHIHRRGLAPARPLVSSPGGHGRRRKSKWGARADFAQPTTRSSALSGSAAATRHSLAAHFGGSETKGREAKGWLRGGWRGWGRTAWGRSGLSSSAGSITGLLCTPKHLFFFFEVLT
jgi:hypothetical protein